ncbi:hypothetical protein I7I53_06874 [Histoplasma capsulatum var. duboisii H88]|uniref:Uncharacterized protein n=1 Tax=Ajellomyces capsulatus (strain H88) TaxID=544711 RepID=A0A8A1LAT3_AJEC8|nr:hypothetical protein I7I53_06874 [Histoplasma capsulatum var. duboisii H88]
MKRRGFKKKPYPRLHEYNFDIACHLLCLISLHMATSLMLISWSRTAPSLTPLTGRYFLTIKYDGSMLCSTSVPSSEEDREWKALLRKYV